MTTTSQQLRAKIQLVRPAFVDIAGRVWNFPDARRVYVEYLCTMHAIIRATVPVMQTALDRCRVLAPHDAVADAMVPYLEKHVPEEQGHDEWVRQDLDALGHDPDEPVRRMPKPAVARLVGAQYYWIHHYHPVCLLGHIAVMEGYPPTNEGVDDMMKRTGYPRTAFRSMIRHAALDQRHRDELLEAIDGMPLQPVHVATMGVAAFHTVTALVEVFEDVHAALHA